MRGEPLEQRALLSVNPFPGELSSVNPLGSLVYSGTTSVTISAAATAGFTLNINAGQTVTVAAHSDSARPTLVLEAPDASILGTATSPGIGVDALLQTIPIANAGVYTITVGLTGAGSGDLVVLDVILNAAEEGERRGGASNSTLSTAQNLDGNFADAGNGSSRAVLLGSYIPNPSSYDDYYCFSLEAGETAWLGMHNLSGETVAMTLLDAAGTQLAQGAFGSANIDQTINGFVPAAAGTYFIRVTGTSWATYSLLVQKNAVFDTEFNGSLAAAQALSSSGIVSGALETTFPIVSSDDFSTGYFGPGWSFYTSQPGYPAIFIGGDTYSWPGDGNAMYMYGGGSTGHINTLVEAVLSVDLTGLLNPTLSYFYERGGSFGQISIPTDFVGHYNGDGVAISGDGVHWHNVSDIATSIGYHTDAVDLTAGAAAAGIELNGNFKIKFQYYGNAIFPDGATWDNIFVKHEQPDEDLYRFSAVAGQALSIVTQTPEYAADSSHNHVDPAIDLIEASGAIVASNENGAADGRNATIVYTPSVSGQYVVRVRGGQTQGEYALTIGGALPHTDAFQFISSTPADGAVLKPAPTQAVLALSAPFLQSSLQASDLTVDGMPASGVTIVNAHTLSFTLPSPLAPGVHNLAVAAGALVNLQGAPLESYSSEFTYDAIGPRVVASSLHDGGSQGPGGLTYTVQFSEPMRTSNLDASDVVLTGAFSRRSYTPTALNYDASGTILTVGYVNLPEDSYTLTLLSGPQRFQDVFQNDLDGEPIWPMPPNHSGNGAPGGNFLVNFTLDHPMRSFPGFAPVLPWGSQVYESKSITTLLASSSDVDSFTVTLEAPQTITLLARGTGLRPTLTLLAPDLSTVATTTAAGENAILQGVAIDVSGTYTISVGSASTGGTVSLQAILNGVVEREAQQGPANDTLATAQSLDANFHSLGSGALAAVVGSEVGDQYASAVIDFSSQRGIDAYAAIQALGPPNTTGYTRRPTAWTATFENGPFEYITVGFPLSVYATGVTIRESWGNGFVQYIDVIDTNGGIHNVWSGTDTTPPGAPADFLATWATTPYLVQAVKVSVKRLSIQFDPMIDSVLLHAAPTPDADIYSFTLDAGESASLAIKSQSGTAALSLLDSAGAQLVYGIGGSTTLDQSISKFVAASAGTYYATVTASPGTKYNLLVTKQAALDIEPNDSITAAQLLAPVSQAVGAIGDGSQVTVTSQNFETGALGSAWSTYGTNNSRIRVTGTSGTNSGSFALIMDSSVNGVYSLNEAIWTVDLTGLSRATLQFAHAGFFDNDQPLPATFTGHVDGDGVSISNDGVNWHTVWQDSSSVTGFTPGSLDLALAAAGAGLPLSAGFKIKFQQYGNQLAGTGGRGWDDIAITTPPMEVDHYNVQLIAGQSVTLATTTPALAPGQLPLDPIIELYSAAAVLLATDDNSGPDGRNALLSYWPTASGNYAVRVRSINTTGEYVLNVSGADATVPPFVVVSTNPANGAIVNSTQVSVTFSAPVLPASLHASDLTANSVPAAQVGLSSDLKTATFTLTTPITEGTNNIVIVGAAITSLQNMPLASYSGQFTYDSTSPRIVSSSIQQGDVLTAGTLTYTVEFSEPMRTGDLSADDIALTGVFRGGSYTPSSIGYDSMGTILTVNYPSLPDDKYTLTLFSGSNRFWDVARNLLDGEAVFPVPPNQSGNGVAGGDFVVSFSLDNPLVAFPTAFVASKPLGSLVYTASATTVIGAAGDSDGFTLDLNAGQTITVVADPTTATLQPSVNLQGPSSSSLGAALATSANQNAVLQTIQVTTAGTYTVTLSGAGGTSGAASVQVILNAAAESEWYVGPSNNTIATAQDLTASFISLGDAASRGAVLGSTSDAGGDHYAFSLAEGDVVTLAVAALTGTTPALVLLKSDGTQLAGGMSGSTNVGQTIKNFVAPASGAYYARLSGGNATYNLLITRNAAFETNPNGSVATAQTLAPATPMLGAIAYSPTLVPIATESFESGSLGSAWSTFSSVTATGRIQVTGAHGTNSGSYALLMDHNVTGSQSNLNEAIWTLDLSGLTEVSLSFAQASYSDLNNNLPTVFTGHRNGDGIAISGDGVNWRTVWFATSGAPGAFSTTTIDLDAAAAAAGIPLDANFQIKFQQFDSRALPARGRGWDDIVVAKSVPGANLNQVQLMAGQPVVLGTSTPVDGTGQFFNDLDPAIDLFDPNGVLVASDDNGAADGRNALLSYTPEESGNYTVRVRSTNDELGEYLLKIGSFVLGDMDGNGVRDNFDIEPFELALTNQAGYAASYPNAAHRVLRGDIDGNGTFDNFDIQSFEQLLTGGSGAAASEPMAASAISQPESAAMTAEAITLGPSLAMPAAASWSAFHNDAIALATRFAEADAPIGDLPVARTVFFGNYVLMTLTPDRNSTSAADEFFADGLNVTRPAHRLTALDAALDPALAALEDDLLDELLLAELSL